MLRLRHDDARERQVRMPLDEIASQSVGFARSRAVADRNQLDAMLRTQLAQRPQRALPVIARLCG